MEINSRNNFQIENTVYTKQKMKGKHVGNLPWRNGGRKTEKEVYEMAMNKMEVQHQRRGRCDKERD